MTDFEIFTLYTISANCIFMLFFYELTSQHTLLQEISEMDLLARATQTKSVPMIYSLLHTLTLVVAQKNQFTSVK